MSDIQPTAGPEEPTRPMDTEGVQVGQWFWFQDVTSRDNENGSSRKRGDPYEWLGCVTRIGTNFVRLESPPHDGSSWNVRLHFDDFWSRVRPELNAEAVIRGKVAHHQGRVTALLAEVQALTARLGVAPTQRVTDTSGGESQALAVMSTQVDAKAYETALVTAQKETLPALFKQIEAENKSLVSWMAAGALPIKALVGPMKKSLGIIEDRIFTVSLYAGLTEEAVQCCDGEVAGYAEPLHVMQRRLYMDEECLLTYAGGGIEIRDVAAFDAWIAEPENRDRLLPFPRSLAAFRVRRVDKEREDGGDMWRAFVNIQLAQSDKKTFLYVRNGEQVWRLDCGFEFEELIFPSETGLGVEPMMVKMFASRVSEMMPVREYESRLADHNRKKAEYDAEVAALKAEGKDPWRERGSFYDSFRPSEWEPFDQNNVYYDEAMETVRDEAKRYNRLAVIIQGLFDRSLVLHPHPQVKTWTPDGFARAIKLVRDGDTLAGGEPPDFEAYRAELNASLGPDSIVTGQEDYWMRREAVKENTRTRNSWRDRGRSTHYVRLRPYGNPGPGLVGPMDGWKPRARAATFVWVRETRSGYGEDKRSTITVPAAKLLNVSAYKPGDFKRFLADHRTRAKYLQWAPLMLAAEDFHAGKVTPGKASNESR